ncbi:M56 family metallopeptidase [Mucilaginibacter sp. X4EP1]|uniref:M56 family metallopeptidase n=1 Tax=Mucilaginibacter sp. X4EP1 TaxID=2723092 RepID=UPI0021671CA8|nr:M56 family metallopeptidase [Mucilaginibacter sp. X4EP1]MCS3816580.1 beta-lactamase regulating signal transducer with metallopeptidase domain [Mucilaginibacter sp. X4EP1]
MESTLYNISQVLGITVIHSLWQGLLVYFILRIIFNGAPQLSAVKKYNLAVIALSSITLWFIYTLFFEIQAYNWVSTNTATISPLIPNLNLTVKGQLYPGNSTLYYKIAGYLPYVSALYLAGLLANVIKLGYSRKKLQQIKKSLIPAGQMQQYINSFAKNLNINKYIQVNFSELIDVPCVTGYLKPIILLPVSIATSLTACEIEAILLHELSHIKRKDYLVNIMQQAIAIILFFNPFARLINSIVNCERENGCDDMVIEKTENPLTYAYALLKLEEVRQPNMQLMLAATGKRYDLLNRIERIMKTKQPTGNFRHLAIAVVLLAASLSGLAWFNPKTSNNQAAIKGPSVTAVMVDPASLATNLSINAMPAIAKIDIKPFFNADSTKAARIADTSKHSKNKIVIVDDKGNKKEYNSVDEMPSAVREEFLKNNFGINQARFDSIRNYYSSAAWKSQVEAISKQAAEIQKQFNSPQWKLQQEDMVKQADEMKKQFNSPQWKSQMEAMTKQAEEMTKQFNSQQWRLQQEAMAKQAEEMKKQFDSPQWKNQVEAMKKQAEEMKKQFDSTEWRKQMELMKKQAEDMAKHPWILQDSVGGVKIYAPQKPTSPEKNDVN